MVASQEFVRYYLGLACTGRLYMNFVADLFHHHTLFHHGVWPTWIVIHLMADFRHSTIDIVVEDRHFGLNGHYYVSHAVAVAVAHDYFD